MVKLRKVELLFHAVRSPYDIAHILLVAKSIGGTVYTAGNSISFQNAKVISKLRSWNITGAIEEIRYSTFEEAVYDLRSKGKYLIGTSGNTEKILYNIELPDSDIVVVFGTESSGLCLAKQSMLDEIVKLPMDRTNVDFLTLPVAVSAVAYELYRQFNYSK